MAESLAFWCQWDRDAASVDMLEQDLAKRSCPVPRP